MGDWKSLRAAVASNVRCNLKRIRRSSLELFRLGVVASRDRKRELCLVCRKERAILFYKRRSGIEFLTEAGKQGWTALWTMRGLAGLL